ncbi:MAG: hypothetical protein ALECFALPRED_010747 [Alectoria fallacina]|uniref:Wings apart-like protein C-terminal domain-containing protein n=1 Tax=Alectoria fallacina TaxID=1903189 RepID=A0A8H3J956_9LECA|nr:MAG: hypothetical protein ALECFALPRED_010747 [Alectoria fallacina]
MAFAGSMAPRRKTTTYGKHSRRILSDLSSATEIDFAQDVDSSRLDPKDTIGHWQGDGRNTSSNSLQSRSGREVQPANLAHQAFSSTTNLRDQPRSSSGRIDSIKDDSLYDVALSDDAREYGVNVARKRRKVMPSVVVAENHSPVYDDDSLQRHIAAEARRDEGQFLRSPSNTSALQDSRSRRGIVKSQAGARGGANKGMSEDSKATPSREDLTLNPKRSGNNTKALDQDKGRLVARKQSKGLGKTNITSHRLQMTSTDAAETSAQPTTPDTMFDDLCEQEANNRPRNPYSSRKSVYQPTTPPRPTSAAGRAITPRQRELWKRLLADNAQIKSPSSLDLSGLILTKEKPEGSHGHAKSRQVSREPRQQPATLKARPRKIVDTLHQSDQNQEHFSDYYHEMHGSSSSDNKSESMRSEVSAADGAITVQTSPSADSQGIASQFQARSSKSSQAISSLFGGCLKVTYARQRSYLTDNDLEEAAMIGLPVPPDPNNRRGNGRRGLGHQVPKMQSLQSLDEEFGDLVDSQGGTMRSIHELREAGGNVRLVGELEAILDDISDHQPGSTSTRRSRLINLVTKLEEPANCRLLLDQGLESRLMADVGLGNDLITNGLLVAALLQLMTHSSSTLLLTQVGNVRVVRFLIDLLGSDQDILSYARLRENNMSKAAQADLGNLCSALLECIAWRAGKPSILSCHVLSLQCLEYLVRQTREAGSLSEVLSAHAIRRVVATSVPPFSTLPTQSGEISLICLELSVSILESCTISNAAECQASLWAGETLERVIGLLPLLALWKGEECGRSRTLTLRLYLNLTNNSPGLCEDFSTPEVISVMFGIVISHFEQLADSTLEIDKALLLDDLILSLGSLINLADLSKIARRLVMDLPHGSQSYLDILLQLFMNKSKNAAEVSSLEETSSNVAFGWVSVLLGWLCVDPAIKARISGRLPGNSLKWLLDAIDEFLQYHRRVDQVIHRGDGEDDAKATFIGRLQSHVDDLQTAEGLHGTFYEVEEL